MSYGTQGLAGYRGYKKKAIKFHKLNYKEHQVNTQVLNPDHWRGNFTTESEIWDLHKGQMQTIENTQFESSQRKVKLHWKGHSEV